MAILSSLNFIYDSISSDSMGLINVNVDISSGLLSEPFMSNRTINEVKIRGRDRPYLQDITEDPLEFTVSFAFEDGFDSDRIRAVARWLFTKDYKKLIFSDNPDRIYYAIFQGNSTLLHNANNNGYISLNVRCDSPYSYSEKITTSQYDLSSNTSDGTTIKIANLGDVPTFPEIYITKVGTGDVEIINTSNSNISFKFTDAIADPTIAPVLSQTTASTPITADTYYVKYNWSGTNGVTNVSSESNFTVTSGNILNITIPELPTNATSANIYISTSTETETKQGTTTTTKYKQISDITDGDAMSSSNTSGLRDTENIYVDCRNEIIITDQDNLYRFANFNNNYLELIKGMNVLTIKGNVKIQFKYSFIYLQG